MNILMLAHRIPYPPHTGDKVRAYHIARHLAAHHRLTLAFIVDDRADLSAAAVLQREIPDLEFAVVSRRRALATSLGALMIGRSLSFAYFHSRPLHARIASRLARGRFDLVYVSSSPMARYVDGLTSTPVIVDFVDVDSDKWRQYAARKRPPMSWVYGVESRRLQRREAAVAQWARISLLATPQEASLLQSFAPRARTAVVPNGVDLAHFAPGPAPSADPTIIFTGAMDYFPNIDAVHHFCADIYPRVRAAVPDARFLVVGLNPGPSVRRLGRLPGVTVTGSVPDVRPYYAQSAVCVAPLRLARGVQNKVLQALAVGLPVVASGVAARGLDTEPGEHLHVENDPSAFADRLISLLSDPAERRALGLRGRSFVETHHSWDASLARLDALIDTATVGSPGSAPAPLASASRAAMPPAARHGAGVTAGKVSAP